jgi:tetratricopeptide (TPR) repeat protein
MQRETRRQLKHDEFVETTVGAVQRVAENPRPWIAGVVAVLLIVAATWTLSSWWLSRRGVATEGLARGLAALSAPVVDGAETSANPFEPTFPTHEEKMSAALERLDEASRLGGKPGRIASFLRGVALLETGDAAGALDLIAEADSALGTDPTLGPAVRATHARALEEAGRPSEAAAIWRVLADAAEDQPRYPVVAALEALARASEAAGDKVSALEAWQRISTEFPDSREADRAAREVARLSG